jgi:hypothetical protein
VTISERRILADGRALLEARNEEEEEQQQQLHTWCRQMPSMELGANMEGKEEPWVASRAVCDQNHCSRFLEIKAMAMAMGSRVHLQDLAYELCGLGFWIRV